MCSNFDERRPENNVVAPISLIRPSNTCEEEAAKKKECHILSMGEALHSDK